MSEASPGSRARAGAPQAGERTKSLVGLLFVAAGAALWGTVGIASKWLYGIDDITPLGVGFYRLALSSPPLAVLCLVLRGSRAFRFQGADLPIVLLLGAAMALYQVTFFTAVAKAGVTLSTLIALCTGPLLIAVLSRAILAEPITRRTASALTLGLAGTALVVGFPGAAGAHAASLSAGVGWAFGAAASYAVFVLCSRALAVRHDAFELIAVGFGAGALLLLPFAFGDGIPVPASIASVVGVLFIGLVPTTLAYALYFTGMRQTGATTASIVSLMEPLTAAVLAWAIFGERLGLLGTLGGAALFGSILILARRGDRKSST